MSIEDLFKNGIMGLNRLEYRSEDMANPNYTILVYPGTFGLIRINLTDLRQPDSYAPEGHGSIVRILDTYKVETASRVMFDLSESEEPRDYCITLERDWNCEMSDDGPLAGDRIRLDETQESNPHRRCAVQDFTPRRFPIFTSGVVQQKHGRKDLK